jgi:hypothetical protein
MRHKTKRPIADSATILTLWALPGDQIGPNPADRAKQGSKKSLLVDGQGGPLAILRHALDEEVTDEMVEQIHSTRQRDAPKTLSRRQTEGTPPDGPDNRSSNG